MSHWKREYSFWLAVLGGIVGSLSVISIIQSAFEFGLTSILSDLLSFYRKVIDRIFAIVPFWLPSTYKDSVIVSSLAAMIAYRAIVTSYLMDQKAQEHELAQWPKRKRAPNEVVLVPPEIGRPKNWLSYKWKFAMLELAKWAMRSLLLTGVPFAIQVYREANISRRKAEHDLADFQERWNSVPSEQRNPNFPYQHEMYFHQREISLARNRGSLIIVSLVSMIAAVFAFYAWNAGS